MLFASSPKTSDLDTLQRLLRDHTPLDKAEAVLEATTEFSKSPGGLLIPKRTLSDQNGVSDPNSGEAQPSA